MDCSMKKVIAMLSRSFTAKYIQRLGKSYSVVDWDAERLYQIHKTYLFCSWLFMASTVVFVVFDFSYLVALAVLFMATFALYCKWSAWKLLKEEEVRELVKKWKEYRKIILGIPGLRVVDEGFRMVNLRDLIQFELDQRQRQLEDAENAKNLQKDKIAKLEDRVLEVRRLLAQV